MPLPVHRALAWSAAERYLGVLLSLASAMILARLLTPAQVGVYSMCAAFAAVASILRDFGVTEYLIQEPDLTRPKLRSAYGVAIAVAWTIGGLIFAGRHWVADFYREPGVADVLAVMALQFALLPLSSPAFALLNRELAFRPLFQLQLACSLAHTLTSVSLAWAGFGTMSLAWAPIASVAVQTLLLALLRPRESLVLPSFRGLRHVLRFSTMYVSSRVIEVLTRNVHEPIIAKQFGFAAVGLFSRALGLIELFNQNVAGAVLRVATPAFAAEHRAGRPLADAYARATAIFVCVSWTFFGFVALLSTEIIGVLFGAQWLAAAPVATSLALASIPQGLPAFAPQMLSATGHVQRRLQVSLLFAPVHIAGVVAASRFDLHWVAAVWLLSNGLIAVLYLGHVRQALGVPLARLLAPSLGSAVCAAASVGAQALVLAAARQSGMPALPTLLAVAAAGAAVWWLATGLQGHPAHDEAMKIVTAARLRLRAR